ncbi:SdpI family protein [Companilactobacillus muriivasis]|uniref:SdpI family protein n=1 Tax=Companilactobacillus muriivasis TaxID=3081444 RepID=UPI0030C72EFD
MKKKYLIILGLFATIWLPALADLFYWNKLPEKLPTHFNAQMVPDSWSSKAVAVLTLPVILTLAQGLILYLADKNSKKYYVQNGIVYTILTIMPILSIWLNFIMISTALNNNVNRFKQPMLSLLFGIILIILGVVLKYVKTNPIFGIRLPWTMSSEKNWRLTNNLGSKVFIVGGIIEFIGAMFSSLLLAIFILAIIITIPVIYSYILYRKGI